MTKRLNRKFSISRRIGAALWGDTKDPYNNKNFPPGVHGPKGYKRKSEYGTQLLAKQKLRLYYGDIRESQFRSTFIKANKLKGDTGENLIGLLESRLDAFVYRCKFAPSIFSARQLVSHKHIFVNKKSVNIPSYRLKPNDTVTIREASRNISIIINSREQSHREVPEYINITQPYEAVYVNIPKLSQVPYPVQVEPNYVVEFYSR